jgi:hypothetical protein
MPLLTPWSRVLPEKLKHPELLKKFPAFYGTRRVITAFTRARHLSLSWARLIQSMPPHPTSRRSILILSSHLRVGPVYIYVFQMLFSCNPINVFLSLQNWCRRIPGLILDRGKKFVFSPKLQTGTGAYPAWVMEACPSPHNSNLC